MIAATARDLEAEVRDGRFREDLYYRLNVLRIHIPPLRERLEDLDALVQALLLRAMDRSGRRLTLAPEALAAAGGNRGRAAELLGVSQRNLFYKLKRLGLG